MNLEEEKDKRGRERVEKGSERQGKNRKEKEIEDVKESQK